MKTKRYVCILLVCIFCLALFVGCGKQEEPVTRISDEELYNNQQFLEGLMYLTYDDKGNAVVQNENPNQGQETSKDPQQSGDDNPKQQTEPTDPNTPTKKDKETAERIDQRIAALGEITLSSRSDLVSIRLAYNKLSDLQKSLVTKLADLEAAEAVYNQLLEEQASKKNP